MHATDGLRVSATTSDCRPDCRGEFGGHRPVLEDVLDAPRRGGKEQEAVQTGAVATESRSEVVGVVAVEVPLGPAVLPENLVGTGGHPHRGVGFQLGQIGHTLRRGSPRVDVGHAPGAVVAVRLLYPDLEVLEGGLEVFDHRRRQPVLPHRPT